MGVFANRTHEIIPVENCLIQNREAEMVAKRVFEFIKDNEISIYDEKTRTGAIRHIIVKIGVKTNEIMCILVTNKSKFEREQELVEAIAGEFHNVKKMCIRDRSKSKNNTSGFSSKYFSIVSLPLLVKATTLKFVSFVKKLLNNCS